MAAREKRRHSQTAISRKDPDRSRGTRGAAAEPTRAAAGLRQSGALAYSRQKTPRLSLTGNNTNGNASMNGPSARETHILAMETMFPVPLTRKQDAAAETAPHPASPNSVISERRSSARHQPPAQRRRCCSSRHSAPSAFQPRTCLLQLPRAAPRVVPAWLCRPTCVFGPAPRVC